MQKQKNIGLTLGKYAPFHKGHQLVIEKALSEMDEVIVIIYDAPKTTSIPLNVRAGWIKKIYPTVRVIEAWDGPTEVGDTSEIKQKHEDYILKKLKIKGITAFYSSEFYGEHMSKALDALNVQVDPERKNIPISSSKIRNNPHKYREFIHPLVYRDLITHVVFLGAPCTGKTKTASRMAEEFNTEWVPEYGREYWEKNNVNRRLTPQQLEIIAQEHIKQEEEKLLQANRYLFTDTNAITTYLFAIDYHGKAEPPLVNLAEKASTRYDVVFLCGDDISYEDTWDRSGPCKRTEFQKRTIAYLNSKKIPYHILSGDLETRVKTVKEILLAHKKINP